MNALGRLLAQLRAPPPTTDGRCAACRHFVNDARALEAALPGLRVLSSGSASVRDDDGLCALHDRFAGARSGCAGFARRD